MQSYPIETDENTIGYAKRNSGRKITILSATMALVYYYVGLGDDLATANEKVDQVSDVLLDNNLGAIIGYEMGNSRQKAKLGVAIDDIDEVTYPFFDSTAKTLLKNELGITV